jgi:hypothetical protein
MREMYARMLRDEGHRALLAGDAVEGLQLLEPKPDLSSSIWSCRGWMATRCCAR